MNREEFNTRNRKTIFKTARKNANALLTSLVISTHLLFGCGLIGL